MERFWAKVDIRGEDECWPWIAAKNSRGYGNFRHKGEIAGAHRIAWELTHGDVPNDQWGSTLNILHICDNPSCCNPDHLYVGTQKDNARDRKERGREIHPTGPRSATKGYSYSIQHRKWLVRIQIGEKRIHLGYYNTEEEAAQVYQDALKELGE